MTEFLLQIDGKEVEARAGTTLLEAARSAGIRIPTLCHHTSYLQAAYVLTQSLASPPWG